MVELEVEDDSTDSQAAVEKGKVTSLQSQGREEGDGSCQEREGNNLPRGNEEKQSKEKFIQWAYWPKGFLHFISHLDEPNIFTGTHVMEEYHLGGKPTKGLELAKWA